ncbi:hypothetical protein SSP24_20120 [Streptomyces spinoverrucosus]|uniref:Uncharacterized protein n=1 Tax=Streptomyces spinoverrucosus TaxID=284043 RepID=A0A4Y3VBM5_9ACTN|nr:hypothetical protein SSP24_20120 [Streptomyces spinoverrucosus]
MSSAEILVGGCTECGFPGGRSGNRGVDRVGERGRTGAGAAWVVQACTGGGAACVARLHRRGWRWLHVRRCRTGDAH